MKKQLETLIEILDEMIEMAYQTSSNSDIDISEYMNGLIMELENDRDELQSSLDSLD